MKICYDHALQDSLYSGRALKWMANGEDSAQAITIANDILGDYEAQGYTLTLRQLYYQFVAQGLVTENSERTYKNLGSLITKGRDAGLISWHALEDRNRSHKSFYFDEDEDGILDGLEYGLRWDFWARQDTYVEVWVEKEALGNVIDRACGGLLVPHMATKGYLSASEAWRAGQRFRDAINDGKETVLIHLADHDPEGLDMTRDNGERIEKYAEAWGDVTIKRIALNMPQVEEHNPPPNYAKISSSRFDGYVSRYGDKCWELDALEPSIIVELIRDTAREYIDVEAWNRCKREQDQARTRVKKLQDHWEDVKEFLEQFDDEYDEADLDGDDERD